MQRVLLTALLCLSSFAGLCSSGDGPNQAAAPVNAGGERSVTLAWMPPAENADGSVLTNLAGYRIYYGRSASTLNQIIVLNNPGLTRFVVEGLTSASWYFAMTSVNRRGVESGRSALVRKTIA